VKLLLDTHAFLWFIDGNTKLSRKARSLIEEDENEKLVSMASLLEIAIKTSLGKLRLDQPFENFISLQLQHNDFHLFPLTTAHAVGLSCLPFHHRDPFDRMIIAQSLVENIPVLSSDVAFDDYGIQRLW